MNHLLNAHITRATQLQVAMTDIERNRIAREGYAAQVFADCMLKIVLGVVQCDFWMERLGVGRVAA